ncbi:MAG: 50S ribosomal protein L11 methyltransferase [Oscillospiraceae bacterium]|nr:50S ribosomal protein L11 methyltransferase [Oscillospiraceae bacterium]
MNWLEINLVPDDGDTDALCGRLDALGVTELVIDDERDLDDFIANGTRYWDYIDEELIAEKRGRRSVRFYLPDDEEGRLRLDALRPRLGGCGMTVAAVKDEDWENSWKEYYKPIETGSRLITVPEWEAVPENCGRVPLRLDPGLIFGTGAHASTRMCLEALEDVPAKRVLDLGCGSGILGIAALLLGAESCLGCDIDDKAPSVAAANAALNGIGEDRFRVLAGDVLHDARLRGEIGGSEYDLVLANIVADVIIALCADAAAWLAPGGSFICSGIIDGRENEVLAAIEGAGLRVSARRNIDNWHSFTAVKSARI